ncbi:hypothetical protein M3697_10140 [Janibacter melonis]|uniref:hypothetical protein n=1 Tax=Janibacter melonis TaxID=262209 RepID=UPI0020446CE7|nr:hypothetical protein [Janibacter melonis]MCM3555462.1 hypothetical protein [Janibacter melonis]
MLAWVGFTVTFALARLVTGVIKIGDQDTGDVVVGGVHLHHYLWGIAIVVAVAIYGLVDRSARTRSAMGAALGVGVALIVDEIALLVDEIALLVTLEDVYWTSEGWSSVAVAVIIIGVVGSALVATRSGRQDD